MLWNSGKITSTSEENKVPRALFESRKVAGSATYKQSKLCCHVRSVYLFNLFSHENKDIFFI